MSPLLSRVGYSRGFGSRIYIPVVDVSPSLVLDLDAATYTGLSANFSGSNNLSVTNSTALNPGTGDFTIEFWTRLTSTTNNASFYRGNNNGVDIFMNGSGRLAMGQAQVSTLITDTVAMTTGAWVHVAAVRISGATRLYKNGVQVGSAGDATNYVTDSVNYIGTQGSFRITGYMSNLRVVIGLGVYTGAFTPPTSALALTQSSGTNISAITAGQTQLLLPLNVSPFTDSSTNAITLTNTGTVVPGVQYPFTAYDATGDYPVTVLNPTPRILWNSANGGVFRVTTASSNNFLTFGPDYSSGTQAFTVGMAYKWNGVTAGRLLNANTASPDFLMGLWDAPASRMNIAFAGAFTGSNTDAADTAWHFIWFSSTGAAGASKAKSYIATSTAPTSTYGTGSTNGGFNQLRLFGRFLTTTTNQEQVDADVGFVKVWNKELTLAEIQAEHATYKARFGY
jgi:hypothetical protein